MKCSIFIATSIDGYIATLGGKTNWLESAGKTDVAMGNTSDMGFNNYMASVDCMIMGRKSMETISSFHLSSEQWPYGTTRIIVLSNTQKEAPHNLKGKVNMYAGDIPALISQLENDGHKHAYIDGGTTITHFLNLKLINEITITRAPILLGEGIPLFGNITNHIQLENAQVIAYPNDFIQIKYIVNYS